MSFRLHSLAFTAALGVTCFGAEARAQSTIKHPGDRPAYSFEAEPHLILAPFDPPGPGSGSGLGLGFRGTIEVAPDGFLPKLNDSVGIGFGLDWTHYYGKSGQRGRCGDYETINGVNVCTELDDGSVGSRNYFFLPVVMQWNFWLHRKWSVFGEPGVALYVQGSNVEFQPLVLYLGGRYHISDAVTLTMRVGYPSFSLGASFLL